MGWRANFHGTPTPIDAVDRFANAGTHRCRSDGFVEEPLLTATSRVSKKGSA